MKKILILMIVLTMGGIFTGCGSKNEENPLNEAESATVENSETSESRDADVRNLGGAENTENGSPVEPGETEDTVVSGGIDNFSAESESVKEFAEKIKECVADKNLERLADLVSYPTYVGFPEGGKIIETKKDFLALDQEKLFTKEMLESIAGADIEKLEASMAGFTMCKDFDEHTPSINFSMVNGEFGITGINF